MFWKRTVSGIILVILAILVIGTGGRLLFFVSLVISLVGLFELYRVLKMHWEPIGFVGYVTSIAYYALIWFHRERSMLLIFICALMLLLTLFVITFPRYKTEQIAIGFFGIFYVVVMMSYVYRVRIMPDGKYLVWLIILSSWGCDTCAYLVGMLCGKHHFAPVLSPKKTMEGCIGGALGAAMLGAVYGYLLKDHMTEFTSPVFACAFACLVSGVLSQIGDFAASAIKRDHQVKDYGDIIPGHGGILDRFDSMLFTATALYYALSIANMI